ncbi:MAG: hypothetical protein Q9181_007315, partial [Wetmoreana brouardii]
MPPKKKPPLTHFLCLPLVTPSSTPQWQKSLQAFTDDIMHSNQPFETTSSSTSPTKRQGDKASIPLKAIRPLGTLHLTIGVMSLPQPERVDAAIMALKGMDVVQMLQRAEAPKEQDQGSAEGISAGEGSDPPPPTHDRGQNPSPLTLSFTGLKSMHAPRSTSLLYVPPTDPTGRLYPFCRALRERFVEEGFMVEEKRELKLHATVLNTIYAGKVAAAEGGKAGGLLDGNKEGGFSSRVPEVGGGEHVEGKKEDDEEHHHHRNKPPELEPSLAAPSTAEAAVDPQPLPATNNQSRFPKKRKQPLKLDAR